MTHNDQSDLVIRTCEAQRSAAMLGGHLDIFSHLFHPDLTYIHSSGAVDTLKSYLEKCRAREFIYHTLDHRIDKVTRVGDLAIALGEMTTTVTSAGVRKHLHNRTLTAWQKTDEQWQLLVYQATPLKPPEILEAL
ncbi:MULTISPECIES: nuclear transport factor 2 family protein [Pseudomonas]|uniref:nuclear transport factor 2 family protein n=1 Tax=Pseudomonas TaxID=286 RepID=UPI000B036A06|nr:MULTISPECIES: nuclear transport factor 2 family protein [unclassified Pseudomonas]MCR8930440.1 nuclear transport factor 2 family protein [Pseudomonas sp. S11A4]MCR8974042.1 nuclear transport factor 2 family protein [Pseudomonas sp. S11P7]